MANYDFPHLVAAIDGLHGESQRGFTFLDRDNLEHFFSFERLREEARNRAAHLRAKGMKKGDRLAMVMPDGQDFVPTFLGAVYAGIIPVPLYPPLTLGKLDSYIDALVAIMNKAGPTYLATNAKIEAVIWSAAARVPSLQGVITAEALTKPAPAEASRSAEEVTGDDIAFLQFTSGSTSTPKGVEVTHSSLRANAWAIIKDGLDAREERDHGVSWLPLFHDMGLIGFVLSPIFHHVPVTFIPTMAFVRNANIWLETLSKKKGTITFAPNFAYALATKRAKPEQMAKWDLSHVRVFGCGAEPINAGTINAFFDKLAPAGVKPSMVLACYGMAEATLAISFIGLDDALSTDTVDKDLFQTKQQAKPAKAGAAAQGLDFVNCGRTFPKHEMAVFNDDGKRLPDRNVGEIWVKGPSIARGYFQDPVASEKTFGGGWLRTGDLGYLVDGQVFITGRKKDLIIINGRNYEPQRIEWLCDDVPEVRKGSTVAFSVPGASSEELIVVVESRTQTPEVLIETVKTKINEQLQLTPKEVAIAPPGSLPKTSSGKIQRAKTRLQYLDGTIGKEGVRTVGAKAEIPVVAKHVALSLFGRGKFRAKKIVKHTLEIRSTADALGKLKLASDYARGLVGRVLG